MNTHNEICYCPKLFYFSLLFSRQINVQNKYDFHRTVDTNRTHGVTAKSYNKHLSDFQFHLTINHLEKAIFSYNLRVWGKWKWEHRAVLCFFWLVSFNCRLYCYQSLLEPCGKVMMASIQSRSSPLPNASL